MATHASNTPESTAAQQLLALRAAELQLPLDAATLQRVAVQWLRLEAMAERIAAQPLGVADEPAMTYNP